MNLFVSNLNFSMQDQDLRNIFAEYGDVSSAKVINDKFTGKSRGFGFVEMPDAAAAQNAITSLDGTSVENKAIRVVEARPREAQMSRGGDKRQW